MLKLIRALINSNIYISLAAFFLGLETQIQLGMCPQWHPYLFIIFFATLFVYNLPRLLIQITNKRSTNSLNSDCAIENKMALYPLLFISAIGFIGSVFMAKKEVLLTLVPLGTITFFYSMPIMRNGQRVFKLREIPYLKIFVIAFVWSASTVLLPVIHSPDIFSKNHILYILGERFFFILAITIPFDIRDMAADKRINLKTIPIVFNEKNSLIISYIFIFIFLLICIIHYLERNSWFILLALSISALTTFIFIRLQKIRRVALYHYGILDGTMILQGVLILLFYQLDGFLSKA